MTTRTFFRAAILLPFIGLAVAAGVARPEVGLPAGWEWVYPTSLTRGVLVYSGLAAWLWLQLDRRPLQEIRRRIWWVPVVYVALGWLLMLGLSLLRGEAAQLWSEQAGAILGRAAVHFAVGYGYLVLVHVALNGLSRGGHLADPAEAAGLQGES
jgi:hypothetical protein